MIRMAYYKPAESAGFFIGEMVRQRPFLENKVIFAVFTISFELHA